MADDRYDILDRRVRLPPHVVYRRFAHETVVVNLERGAYHGLNPSAGSMLEALERASTVRGAVSRLQGELGQPAETIQSDLLAFCGELLNRGLVELVP